MFKKLYTSVTENIKPDDNLVSYTKQLMYNELKSKPKINFYKYASIAACFVIFIGALSLNIKTTNSMESIVNSSEQIEISDDIVIKENQSSNISDNLFNANFSDTNFGVASVENNNSFFSKIISFITNIIQWFKELLF